MLRGNARVAERECHHMRVFERRKKDYWKQSGEHLCMIWNTYWREGAQNEKYYLREGVEPKEEEKTEEEKRAIVEILT